MGYWSENEAVIKEITLSGPESIHLRTEYIPDYEHDLRQSNFIYHQNHRQFGYIGDWHSHPNGSCDLSRQDKQTLRRIASDKEAQCPNPIMLIIGHEFDQISCTILHQKPYIWGTSKPVRCQYITGKLEEY